ncbi:MAG: MBL fold metallo-hydrolase [Dysgonamonadaceae bacterium]|jgi:glyoxylase-like metal-dependent hydrolase (beta-lactamase superfamily II)|nr:MBL fold metallo-hydrolase [Dysgonamonadaceae bacterium]
MMQIQRFEFNQIEENTYVIYDETNDAAIIDCGAFFSEEQARLQQFISGHQLSLKQLLNTHLHADHIFGNQFIYDTYGILSAYHQLEDSIPPLKEQSKYFNLDIMEEKLPAAYYIDEGDLISIGNMRLKALLIPGHSPGSLCFYSEADHCVFTGDVLFEESIGRSDLWGGNYPRLVAGIKEKLLTLPDNTVVYPGHGPATTIQHEKLYNPYLK